MISRAIVLALCAVACFVSSGNAQRTLKDPGNYVVVIGAFAERQNAEQLSKQAASKFKLKTSVDLNAGKNLYYVFVMQTDEKEDAVIEAERVREISSYKDAWVFTKVVPEVKKEEPVIEEVKQQPVVVVEEVKPVPVVDPAKEKEEKIKAEVEKKTTTMKKGDVETLDHIYFYKDAAILRPESKYEVDRLVKIMQENPNLKIKIHGHTNGNDPGKIIRRKDASSDMFTLDNTVEDYGSAKDLSQQRANCIKDYLVSNGIDTKRMTIKAWGGKKPLYKVDDPKAEANVRVDVEAVNQ